MDAANVAAHRGTLGGGVEGGGVAGGELTLLIVNKVTNDDTRNVASHQRGF